MHAHIFQVKITNKNKNKCTFKHWQFLEPQLHRRPSKSRPAVSPGFAPVGRVKRVVGKGASVVVVVGGDGGSCEVVDG